MTEKGSRRLTRREALAATGGLAISGLAGCARTPKDASVLNEGFESGLSAWDFTASIGPEEPVSEFEWGIERSQAQAHTGDWSLEVFTEGDHDDGTAWAIRPITINTAEVSEFTVSAYAWSPSESFNTLRHFVMALAPQQPRDEGGFPDPGQSSTDIQGAPYGGLREPLHQADGWKEYTFRWRPGSTSAERLWLAIGVSVVWEADATHYIDDVVVEVT